MTIKNKWKNATKAEGKFLFPVKAMSLMFRGKYLSQFKADMAMLGLDIPAHLKSKLYRHNWVVFAKNAFAGPKSVVEYLGRYSHKSAISNYRIKDVSNDRIQFHYKDYKHGGVQKIMALNPQEFVRRFSLHILPKGFTKIRHYGILSSRAKATVFPDQQKANDLKIDWIVFWKQKGLDVDICPRCKKPLMVLVGEIQKRGPPKHFTASTNSSSLNFNV